MRPRAATLEHTSLHNLRWRHPKARRATLRNTSQISARHFRSENKGKERGLTTSDGSIRKLEHGLVDHLVREGTDERGTDEPLVTALAAQYLRNAVLLAQERLLVHLVEQAALAGPRAERLEILKALFLRSNVAHLDYDERVLVRRASGKKHICIKLARCPFDTITEMPQKRRCSRTVEAASHEEAINGSQTFQR